MGGIEPLVILPMAAFHLPVMSWCKGPDHLVADAVTLKMHLEQGGLVPVSGETVREFRPVVRLDTLNGTGKGLHEVFKEHGGGIGTVLLKGLHVAPSGIFVNGGILEKLFANDAAVDKTGGRNEFDVDLDALPGIIHLLVRLGDVFGVRRMDGHDALLFEEAVEAGYGSGVAPLHELDPENDEAGIGISSAHVGDELDFIGSMLVGVMVWSAGAVPKRFDGAVVATFPAVDVLPVGLVLDGGFGNPIFISISD